MCIENEWMNCIEYLNRKHKHKQETASFQCSVWALIYFCVIFLQLHALHVQRGVVSVMCLITKHKGLCRCSLLGFVSHGLCCLFVQLVEKSPLSYPLGETKADIQRQGCLCILVVTKPSYTCQRWNGRCSMDGKAGSKLFSLSPSPFPSL